MMKLDEMMMQVMQRIISLNWISYCRALKFVFNDFESSYDYLHGKVIFIALHVQGLKCVPTAIETYKIIHGNGPVYIRFYRTGGKFFGIDTITCPTSSIKTTKFIIAYIALVLPQPKFGIHYQMH